MLQRDELIVRGAIAKRIGRGSLEAVRAEGEALVFDVAGEPMEPRLGATSTRRWASTV